MKNTITWFEIPATDINRAASFYSGLYQMPFEIIERGEELSFYLPMDSDHSVSGSVVQHAGIYSPSPLGVLIYLAAGDDLTPMLNRIEAIGGKVLSEKTLITPEIGYMALFLDSEGNRLALHSPR